MYYFLLGLLIYSFLLISIAPKSKVLSEILGIILLTYITFMIGLRFEVGVDYASYKSWFDIYYTKFSMEFLFYTIQYAIKVIFDKFYYFTFTMILLSNIFIYLGLRKRKIQGVFLILALIIYSSSMSIIFMNIMRQGVSIAIFFYASTFIKERNFKKYILYIFIGAGFHLSSLFLIPLYFFPSIRISKAKYFLAIISAYIIVYIRLVNVIINFIAYRLPFYSKYYNHAYLMNNEINLLSLGVLLNVSFFCLLLIFLREEKDFKLEITYYQLGILFNILTLATFMIDRIGLYFSVFGIAAIPNIIQSIKNRKLRTMFVFLAIIVYLSLFTQNLLINPGHLNLEYKSIFNR